MAVVLTTGCSTGFGLETAIAFARRGDTSVATMRNLAKAERLRQRAAAEGLTVEIVALDVDDDASVEKAVAEIRERFGPVDVLVNNAGVGYGGAIETVPEQWARALIETNFWGAFRMIRAVVPEMRERRNGVIINISSLAGRIPGMMYDCMYSVSKHALGALSEGLAEEINQFGVRVVCIEPGFFATAISENGNATEEGIAGTEYERDAAWFDAFMAGSVENGADPRIVADAIVAAAFDPNTRLHVPVGEDADAYLALYQQARTFEKWVEVSIPVVEAVVGPRPEPA